MRASSLLIGGLLIILLVACGPSPEQIATQTASAWTATPNPTSTPVPTFTPTPVPYDLSVYVKDKDGNLVLNSFISFPQAGINDPMPVDISGKMSWSNLTGPNGLISVNAQGYFNAEQSLNLERGSNEIEITLERDPFGLLSSEACAPDECLLYLDDFQDGEAQNWRGNPDVADAIYVGPAPDNEANSVFTYDGNKLIAGLNNWLGLGYQGGAESYFGDVVWRMHFMVNEPKLLTFNFHEAGPSEFDGNEVQGTVYTYRIQPSPWNLITLHRTIFGTGGDLISDLELPPGTFINVPEQWHWMEISLFQGHLQIWVDGKLEDEYQEALALPPGLISMYAGFAPITEPITLKAYFDNISVCSLNGPFMSLPDPMNLNGPNE